MAYALVNGQQATELQPGQTVTLPDGSRGSWETINAWSDADRAAHGIVAIQEPVVPTDQQIASSTLQVQPDGSVVRNATFGLSAPPDAITRIQFWMAVAANGDIPQADALAYATNNTIPPRIATALGNMTAAQQYRAKMLIFSSPYKRNGTLAAAIQNLLGKTDADMDALWRAGSKIT